MTHAEYTETYKLGQRTAAYRILRVTGSAYSSFQEISTHHMDALLLQFHTKGTPRKKVPQPITAKKSTYTTAKIAQSFTENVPQIAPQPATPKSVESAMLFIAPLFVSLVSISVTICGLFMFAGWFGLMAGVMFAGSLISALMVARNKDKFDTSTEALNTVLYMELSACILHVFTFYVVLPEVSDYIRMPAAFYMSAFVAYLSFKNVVFVRDYNAE